MQARSCRSSLCVRPAVPRLQRPWRSACWPNIIPPDVTIREAAAPPQSAGFALVGALFIIPFILVYTAWSYYVFRGKVKAGEGYK